MGVHLITWIKMLIEEHSSLISWVRCVCAGLEQKPAHPVNLQDGTWAPLVYTNVLFFTCLSITTHMLPKGTDSTQQWLVGYVVSIEIINSVCPYWCRSLSVVAMLPLSFNWIRMFFLLRTLINIIPDGGGPLKCGLYYTRQHWQTFIHAWEFQHFQF